MLYVYEATALLLVYKSMLNKLRNAGLISGWKTTLQFAFIIIMFAGLFFSRFLLSAGMIGFIILCFLHVEIHIHLRNYLATPLLWGISLLFLIPLISGAWSEDKDRWLEIVKIKTPLLFLPLAFAGPIRINRTQWQLLAYIFIAFLLGSTIWTMSIYLSNTDLVNTSYLQAKTMDTPLGNDHVRYSWLISIGFYITAVLAFMHSRAAKWVSLIWIVTALWFLIFLHILSARTGLLSAYLMILLTVTWLFYKKINQKTAIVMLLLAISLPFLAYQTLPSFQNKIKFFLYEKGFFEKTNYLAGSTDAVRIISIKAGWELMNETPLQGKGFGDIQTESVKWYEKNYPGMKESDKILPSSEWMIYGAGGGWSGLLIYILSMGTVFFTRSKNKLVLWTISVSAIASLFFDVGLEVQYGVFLYPFVLLCGWKWLNAENI